MGTGWSSDCISPPREPISPLAPPARRVSNCVTRTTRPSLATNATDIFYSPTDLGFDPCMVTSHVSFRESPSSSYAKCSPHTTS
eukprot:6118535-Pyramimonas_sp.AAC.1